VNEQTASDWLVGELKSHSVEWIATLCGHGLDPLFHSARKAGIRLIDVRNEQTAGYIAEAYGRLTRRPGVCASSSGVAAANAMTGVMNAWFDHAPMLYISGSANLTTLGIGCFQDCDQVALLKPVTKFSRLIDVPHRTVQLLDEAWNAACAAPCGPVHLMFPMDVQRSVVDRSEMTRPYPATSRVSSFGGQVDSAAAMLREAKRPLIIAGSGVYYSGEGEALLNYARRCRIPFQIPIWDRGICDTPQESFCGVIGALTCDPGLLARADCVVLAGVDHDYRVGYLQQEKPVASLDAGWADLPDAGPFNEWCAEARNLRANFSASVRAAGEAQRVSGQMHALDIVDALRSLDATIIIDGGSIGQWAHHLIAEHRYPSHWLSCGRSGVVGYGLGAAIAARLAFPTRPVVLLSGDGAFTFTPAELECAVRQNLHFTAIVADDQKWGITHAGHLRQFGGGMATELGPIRFDLLAQSMGASGVRVTTPDELGIALLNATNNSKVTVIHAPISGGNPSL
jgi:acetolactate synthase-1/2/3 large subunit